MSNDAQIDYWNGRAGEKWRAMQDDLDAMLAPVTAALMARVGDVSGAAVLDIGCGTGQTCLLLLDKGAAVTGVDVSEPMLALAGERTDGRAALHKADASTWRGDAPLDMAFSRFGVMFFDDPHAAFANIAANLNPGARLLFACWRPAKDNEWVSRPLSVLAPLMPDMPAPEPHAPGPFAFADKDRLTGILEGAGFGDLRIEPLDFDVTLARTGGVEAAARFTLQIGPAAAALAEQEEAVRDYARTLLEDALSKGAQADGAVKLGGAIWVVEGVLR
jgi:SAM-dependent methyltransferase